ncbi:acylphosphatase [Salininema proteolyticum]|uniref:Acylphosphatase n=1 Tax=Salininema proteolyticum TaxID=1607685 RepID=A0ABV8U492_9ACTN
MKRVLITVTGRVQGVCFRAETQREATRRGLTGWVRNRTDGTVQIACEGHPEAVDALTAWAATGPPAAEVTTIETRQTHPEGTRGFTILPTAIAGIDHNDIG